jgi:hypothetical protein
MTIPAHVVNGNRSTTLWRVAAGFLAALLLAGAATAQVTGLYYQEIRKDGTIYVFNTYERYQSFQTTGDMGKTAITLTGRGPNGETLVGENATAIDMFLFKNNLPGYDRPTAKATAASSLPKTTVGGRIYADFTSKDNKDDGTGVKSSDSGIGADVKRFYLTVTSVFDPTWSVGFKSDIGDVGAKRYDVFVKNAYLQAKLDDAAILRFGAADAPWIPFVEGLYGQRYVENTLTDALSFGTSADWGVHLLGKAADNMLDYQFSVVNGKGYSSPSRSKTVDFEGRVALRPVDGLTLAIGGYSGKRGLETDAAPAKHTATRFDVAANYATGPVKIGAEYFTADNWNQVTTVAEDKADGYSGWLQFKVDPQWTLFGRYDSANPSKDLKPSLKFDYYNLGVQWQVVKPVMASLVYKYAQVKNGTFSTSNGTIGSTVAGQSGKYNEVGLWFSLDF